MAKAKSARGKRATAATRQSRRSKPNKAVVKSLAAKSSVAPNRRRVVVGASDDQAFLLQRRVEDLAQGYVSMAAELWIVKDRMAVLEHLLEKHGLTTAAIDSLEPSGEFKQQLDAARREFAQRAVAALFPRGLPKVG
jgi:hypothetical protein